MSGPNGGHRYSDEEWESMNEWEKEIAFQEACAEANAEENAEEDDEWL